MDIARDAVHWLEATSAQSGKRGEAIEDMGAANDERNKATATVRVDH